MPSRTSKLPVIVFLLCVAGIAYAGYHFFFAVPHGDMSMAGGAPPVSVAEPIERDIQEWHEFSGRLVAVNQAEIRPRVSGTIDSILFKDGAMVKKGDLLFIIDPRPFQAAWESASARAEFAQGELKRAQSLIADKALPQREFEQRKNAYAVASADLTTARLNLAYTHITAPISGKVSRAEITVGNLVEAGPNAPLLTTIVTFSPIYADFEIDEASFLQYARNGIANQDIRKIPVRVNLDGESTPHEGHVESFDNRLSNASGTIRARAVIENKDAILVPGLFARVQLGTPEKTHSLLITDRAVGTDQNKKFVFVVGDDNKATYREVKLGGAVDNLRIVREGLNPGEHIIVNGLQRARPGQPVTPEVVSMEDPKPEDNAQKPDATVPEASEAKE